MRNATVFGASGHLHFDPYDTTAARYVDPQVSLLAEDGSSWVTKLPPMLVAVYNLVPLCANLLTIIRGSAHIHRARVCVYVFEFRLSRVANEAVCS